jgi:16S rRNA (guanine527-N7)-methyltransferase
MFRELLAREFSSYGGLSDAQLGQLEAHYQLLLKWNRKLNLTRITALAEAVRLHYCESLFLARVLPKGDLRIADVGSGAGFPGIPVAITRPECCVALIESDQRKAVFLREATRELPNVEVIASRAEGVRRRFDWVVSRAVRMPPSDLAHSQALLVGESAAKRLGQPWSLIRSPWGSQRHVAVFHVELL